MLLLFRRNLRTIDGRLEQLIPDLTLECILRHTAGYHLVKCRRQRIDIRPRSLHTLSVVLLRRRITALQQYRLRHLRILLSQIRTRRAKIQQLHSAICSHHQIVRRDIAVQKPFFMDVCQRQHDRPEHFECLIKGWHLSVLLQPASKRNPLHILHDQIGGLIFLKIIPRLYDTRHIQKRSKNTRLPQEAVPSLCKIRPIRLLHDPDTSILRPPGKGRRKVFFDHNLLSEQLILRQIGNAEPALSQAAAHPIAPVQAISHFQPLFCPHSTYPPGSSVSCAYAYSFRTLVCNRSRNFACSVIL